jgi:hypothetical protein
MDVAVEQPLTIAVVIFQLSVVFLAFEELSVVSRHGQYSR